MPEYLTRFAPSPTGRLHLGHAASAFHVWDGARAADGRVLLRIEDIDQTRCRPEFEAGILEDLAWLGLAWDGPVRRQSEHFGAYQAVITALAARVLVYRCFLTRREIADRFGEAATTETGGFVSAPLPASEEAARLEAGEAYAWRLSLARARAQLGGAYAGLNFLEETPGGTRRVAARPDILGDAVLARKDTPASYHLACCHDDALQGITHVIRGEDLREVTHLHVLLQALMGWPQPAYRFHPLVLGPGGQKLSKRFADTALAAYRARGLGPEDIRRMAGWPQQE